MRALLILLGATALATPVAAQAVDPACPPEHAAMGHCTPAAGGPSATPPANAAPSAIADPHGGHAMPSSPVTKGHAGHNMPMQHGGAPAAGAHSGRKMPALDPHAGHVTPATQPDADNPPVAPPPAAALVGPRNAADRVFGAAAMTEAREILRKEHGAITTYSVLVDQLEARIVDGRDGYFLNAQAWYGGDIDRLWLKSEVEADFGRRPEQAEVQALWSHALDPWFNLQTGVRYDLEPDPERAHFVLGLQGLAPYWFEVDGALFLSEKGDVTARFEAEYDQRITQRLILQPRAEIDFAFQDVPEIGVGSGLSKAEAGLRLRYEITREFAPYVGVEYSRSFGDTADFARAKGEKANHLGFVIGVRAWF